MENITKKEILESIGKVYEQAHDCQLDKSFFESVRSELTLLSKYFETSENQALFLVMVFVLNYKGNTVGLSDLIHYFDCNPMKLLTHSEDLESLVQLGILRKQKTNYRRKASSNEEYTIHEKVIEAILSNQPLPKVYKQKVDGIVDVLEELYQLADEREYNDISTHELFRHAGEIMERNSALQLIQKVQQFSLGKDETYLFFYLIWKTILGYESTDVGRALESIYDRHSRKVNEMQKILSGQHVLIKNGWVEIKEARFFNDTEMKLTDASLQLLNDSDVQLFMNKKKQENILLPSEIVYRELIFDKEEMKQLDLLEKLLQEDKFQETQTRLTEKGLPKGIAVLLHGAPGTGKTEIVKQLAKATDREIMKVEISQSKSMWFGESEKIIKRIFTNYKTYAKDVERTPILLFNEADAIISKRKENSNSNVAQTENAIQNIILEELESFEGILMATTNLANNLDTAFERRFLFKVLFKKPTKEVRAKIWKSKLPYLADESCQMLAEGFNFSGGEIDNIIRKSEIQEIVHGTKTNFEQLQLFCQEETLEIKSTKIGFRHAND